MSENRFLHLATTGVRALQPYQPGKPLDELEREYGVKEAVKLASNENPLGPNPRVIKVIQDELADITRYPDGNGFALKKALADKHHVQINQVTLGNGSNDLLELITRAFVTPEHEVLFSQHAFAVYPIVTQAVGAKAVIVPAKNWGHDLDAMAEAISDKTRVIFIANPNNPTGTWLQQAELQAFLDKVPSHALVVLDEAYFEFASDARMHADGYPNGIEWLGRYPNLIVTRTFSKAYGLAGLRAGYSLSHADISNILNRVRQPFNMNSLALAAAVEALSDYEYLDKGIETNANGMQQYIDAFNSMGLSYIPSVGNFICVDVNKVAAPVYDAMLYEGVIVRPVANYEMPNHLRISIGTEKENQRCIAALKKVLNK